MAALPANGTPPEIIGIVVNEKGLERALATPGVTTVGYPYSISAYFRRANANMTRAESRVLVEKLKKDNRRRKSRPGDLYFHGFRQSLRRTLGRGNRGRNARVAERHPHTHRFSRGHRRQRHARTHRRSLSRRKGSVAGIELGVHLHSRPENAEAKILAAYEAGCRRFDSALTGLGGCPFAGDTLVGNIATEDVLAAVRKAGGDPGIDSSRAGSAASNDQRDSLKICARTHGPMNLVTHLAVREAAHARSEM